MVQVTSSVGGRKEVTGTTMHLMERKGVDGRRVDNLGLVRCVWTKLIFGTILILNNKIYEK